MCLKIKIKKKGGKKTLARTAKGQHRGRGFSNNKKM